MSLRPYAGAIALMTLGGGAGLVAGHVLDAPLLGCWAGATLGVAAHLLRDDLRSRRLIRWLRQAQGADPSAAPTQAGEAPRDSGRWGELAYRIERLLRQREAALAAEQAQLADFLSAIEASPNGVLLLDADELIVWCNSVAADHFGLHPVRDRGQRVTNLLRAPAFVARLQGGAGDEAIALPTPRGDGTLSVLIRRYGHGMRLVLSMDVTERLRHEAMRRDFVANVSHEIRTPLTVLAGFVETLANLPLTDVERSRVLALMAQQTQRIQTLVGDLLVLAQLEGSPRPAADSWVGVAALLQQARTEAEALSRGRHTLVFPPDAALAGAQLAGSQPELLSGLANLVSNAVRYTPEGGRVEVGWQLRRDGAGVLAVSDTGIGIAREHLPRLTERFYRVDGSRSRETGGTGLGLSIVKHIAARHGGELQIHSEPGKGSTFGLLFPPARVRVAEGAAGGPAQPPAAGAPLQPAPADQPAPRHPADAAR